jgi:hypothetical protein
LGLDIDTSEPDGRWFQNFYGVHDLPHYAVLDPDTGECLDQRSGYLLPATLAKWLYDFLLEHPTKSLPVEFQLRRNLYEDDEKFEEPPPPEDEGPQITIMIQLLTKKHCKIEIGENLRIRKLYEIIAEQTNQPIDSFDLIRAIPKQLFDDLNAKIKDLDLKNTMIIVSPKQAPK